MCEGVSSLCLQGDLHTPVAGISAPQLIEQVQVQEELTEVTSHTSQPVSSTIRRHFLFFILIN